MEQKIHYQTAGGWISISMADHSCKWLSPFLLIYLPLFDPECCSQPWYSYMTEMYRSWLFIQRLKFSGILRITLKLGITELLHDMRLVLLRFIRGKLIILFQKAVKIVYWHKTIRKVCNMVTVINNSPFFLLVLHKTLMWCLQLGITNYI